MDERLEIIRQQHHLQASSAAVERKDLFDATQRVSFEKHEDGHEWGNVGPLLPALFRVESEMLFVRNCVVKSLKPSVRFDEKQNVFIKTTNEQRVNSAHNSQHPVQYVAVEYRETSAVVGAIELSSQNLQQWIS